jgi:DNA-binding CsgD family transcriptional regulator
METIRMHLLDAMRQAERRNYEGKPTAREERPEYLTAKIRHAGLHAQSEHAALSAEASRSRHSSHALSETKRVAIRAALADGDLSILEIADQFQVHPNTVETIKAELDEV